MKKQFLCLTLLLLISICSCTNKESNLSTEGADTFIVGMECAYAPFNWTETKQTIYNYPIEGTSLYADGYDVQIAKAIAASLGKVLVIKAIEWDGLTAALESGKIDAIIAGMSPTEERKQSVDFTSAYYTSTHVLLMKTTSQYVNGKTLNDFINANVVGQQGTLYDTLIDQLVSVNHQTPLDDVPTIVTALNSNRSDITILEEPVAKGIVAQNPTFTYIYLEDGFQVSEEDVCVSIAIKKGQDNLLAQINSILDAISNEVRKSLMDQAVERAG